MSDEDTKVPVPADEVRGANPNPCLSHLQTVASLVAERNEALARVAQLNEANHKLRDENMRLNMLMLVWKAASKAANMRAKNAKRRWRRP